MTYEQNTLHDCSLRRSVCAENVSRSAQVVHIIQVEFVRVCSMLRILCFTSTRAFVGLILLQV